MTSYPNIKKSGFQRGVYVGYCKGSVYSIRNIEGVGAPGMRWRGTLSGMFQGGGTGENALPAIVYGKTLADISAKLTALE